MENKKEDKYLEPVKEGIFTKIANFFKSIFSKKKNNDTEIPVVKEIQKRYETEGYDLTLLTNEEYEELKLLYQEQISTLNRRYENRVRELKTVRTKIQKMEAKA